MAAVQYGCGARRPRRPSLYDPLTSADAHVMPMTHMMVDMEITCRPNVFPGAHVAAHLTDDAVGGARRRRRRRGAEGGGWVLGKGRGVVVTPSSEHGHDDAHVVRLAARV